ncbi:MAG: hypothetical protein IT459_12740 [Planctomycetes bacterium]|nr:hypothetical protein [Planctomycetota bacterium]
MSSWSRIAGWQERRRTILPCRNGRRQGVGTTAVGGSFFATIDDPAAFSFVFVRTANTSRSLERRELRPFPTVRVPAGPIVTSS